MRTTTIAHHVSRAKARRLVAAGRLIACTLALAAASIGYATHGTEGHAVVLTAGWWIVSAAIYRMALRPSGAETTPLILVFDLAVIAVLLMTTGGVASVYFPMIVMPPFAANLMYGPRAIIWVAIAGVVVYASLLVVTDRLNDPRLMIMRFGVVVLLGAAVVLRAQYEERVRQDMEQLATWPRVLGGGRSSIVRELLGRAGAALRATRVAAVWQDRDASTCLAILDGAQFELDEDPLETIVVPELAQATAFLAPGFRAIDGRTEPWSGPALSEALAQRLRARTIIGARFNAQTVRGWLFVLDVRDASADDVRLAEVVAHLASAGLDQVNFEEMMAERATNAERMRLSRDLHDGLLQSLGGLAMHAEGARRTAESDPHGTAARLQMVVEQLVDAQRALRDFVDELRPQRAATREPLHSRLEHAARVIERQWNVTVELNAEVDALTPAQANEVVALFTEAATNAAKHSGARKIRGRVTADGTSVEVHVEDDGRGFPFRGRYELPQLLAGGHGSWSLNERVSALGGQLAIESSERGSRVDVRLPRGS